MANKFPFTITLFLLFLAIINNQSSSARNLAKPIHHHYHNHHKITFLIKDVFNKSKPATTKLTSQLPFPKPLGLFPPYGGIPIPESGNSVSVTGASTQTLDLSSIGPFFPARATLQELEFGTLMVIDEDLLRTENSGFGSQVFGKAQGVYVASSEDGDSHMIAMTASFAKGEYKDGLRFFGVHRKDAAECHIAVIGGTGKYDGANGYATVKAVADSGGQEQESNKCLLFSVYLI